MTHDQTYEDIKADVLGGMSGYAASKKRGLPSLKYANRLANDPDIVAAKEAGQIRHLAKRTKSDHDYRRRPHVIDVLDNGMTQAAAAAKHGVSQPLVARHIKLALAGASQPTTPQPYSPEAQTLATTLRLLAASSGKSAKALWDEVAAVI